MQVELKAITHCLDKRTILNNINITVQSGQCLVVSGRSGCGKSLLFSILCGIYPPDHGEVLIDGKAISAMNEAEYMQFRRFFGVVFQVSAMISNLSLSENLMLPLNQHCPEYDCQEKEAQIEQICYEFGLVDYLEQRTDLLSTGLASLAGLARALLLQPHCLVWDAPMAEIDLQWSNHVNNRLRHLKKAGTSLILFTNRQQIIESLADIQLDLTLGQTIFFTQDK